MQETLIVISLLFTSLYASSTDDVEFKKGIFACKTQTLTRGLIAASEYSKYEGLRFMKNHNCVFSYTKSYAVSDIQGKNIRLCSENGNCNWVPHLNPFLHEPKDI